MPKSTSPTAADVLGPLLRHRVAAFRAREVDVRLDEPNAAHRFCVSARRLRSLLAAFGDLLDPAICEALDVGLRKSISTVAEAREAELVRRRMESLLSDADPPAVRTRLTELLDSSYEAGRQQAVAYFDSPGYDTFTRLLDGFADLPPWRPAARTAAHKVFLAALRQQWTGLLGKGRQVRQLEAGPERDHQLGEVRKAAKRVKDVAEAQASISGRKVRRLGKSARRMAQVLGRHQDLVVTDVLLRKADPVADDVVHRVQERDEAAAEQLYDEFLQLFRDADRKSLRKWMS